MKKYKKNINDKPIDNSWNAYYDFFYPLIEKIQTKEHKVKIALFSAIIDFSLTENNKETAKNCIDLVKKWLKDHNSVTEQQLRSAAYVNTNAAAASYTAYAVATNAAYSAAAAIYSFYAASANAVTAAVYYANAFDSILLYLDTKLNQTQYLTKTKILEGFAKQDADSLTQTDIDMILDYIKEDQELDLTNLSVNPRILTEFIRNQL